MSNVPEEEVEAEIQKSSLKLFFNTIEDGDVIMKDAIVEIIGQSNDDDNVNDDIMVTQNISDPQDKTVQGLMDEEVFLKLI